MNGAALDRVFRAASGRIIAALAARFRDLDIAEEAFAESCLKALRTWQDQGVPRDPAAWLYRVAERVAFDALRKRHVRERQCPDIPEPEPTPEDTILGDSYLVPDERLRLIFICCHPAIASDARAALTLRLVCGLTVTEIARAFLVQEATLAQRLVRAKRKIHGAGVAFELPAPEQWPNRLEAILSTLEVAYSKAHEDASGKGAHAEFAGEVIRLSTLLSDLMPDAGETFAFAAVVHYAEARRPARVDDFGVMIPLDQQNPELWQRSLIATADRFLQKARELAPSSARTLQAELQSLWCARRSRNDLAPWKDVLATYDRLLLIRDDPIVRLNRAVAVAEIDGPSAALAELDRLPMSSLSAFLPFHAARADFLRRAGRPLESIAAYQVAISLEPSIGERRWLERKVAEIAGEDMLDGRLR